ncbi:BAALC binder of MAP3K1 and KLF4 a [Alosa sapidissima]|uniref:BAALC binder of MAP3K1 and KLF4 a n=1 Tax=Alosa sapidissima TaxID=34773 RepID=UPI001C0A4D0C|nr:BAALC binder of MAP3K1 and KLF4 a [Alosa sapidissima]
MGCGGSRADTIEPRYYESWTRETESTWLTNTDTEIGQAMASNNNNQRGISDTGSASIKQCTTTCSVKGEDGRPPGQVPSTGAPSREKKMVNTATQCGKPPLNATGSSGSKGRLGLLHREESKPKGRKLSSKEAVVSKSVQQSSCPEDNTSDGK